MKQVFFRLLLSIFFMTLISGCAPETAFSPVVKLSQTEPTPIPTSPPVPTPTPGTGRMLTPTPTPTSTPTPTPFFDPNGSSVERPLKSTTDTSDDVNVVIVLDNSMSMAPSQQLLSSGIRNLATNLQGFNANFYLYTVDQYANAIGPSGSWWSSMYQDPTDANLYTIVPNAGRNTQYRSVTKNMTSQELQTFSQGLENEIKSIPLDPNLVNEQTLCAEMDILNDPRPNRAVDFSKPTAMIHITDENDMNTACHYGYRKSRYTYGAYNLISVKAVYVQTTRKERNETINDGYYLDVNSQASLDLYNRQSNTAMVDCSEEVKVQLRARGIADSSYLTCQSRQVWWDYGRTYSVADGASCIGRDEAISLGYANDYNFIRCVHADSNTVDNWNAEMWSNLVPKFTDLVGEKTAGYSKFMYYPIAYFNDRANECAGKDTSNMTHGQSFLNLSGSLQSKGSKVAIGDICAADYGAGLRSVVGGFIYQTHIRVYEIGPTANVHAIVRVQLKNNQNQLQVLPPTMYEMRITGNTAYVKINDAVNLDNIASVIINYN